MSAALTPSDAKAVYDFLGRRVDWLGFYEARMVRALLDRSRLGEAQHVFEFGCGTGRVARDLFTNYLDASCRYVGADISERMGALARAKLAPWSDRARVIVSENGSSTFADATFDRFLSTFVLDLLDEATTRRVIEEAHRVLARGGLLCLTSMSHPETAFARMVTGLWWRLWRLDPRLVGGCRPVDLKAVVPSSRWQTVHYETRTVLGVTSAILVASRQ